MITLKRFAAVLSIVSLFAASGLWLYGRYTAQRQRSIVWEKPIRFENDFALKEPFTVSVNGTHYLAIGYRKDTVIKVGEPIPVDDFSTEFVIDNGMNRIVAGTSGGSSRTVIVGGDRTTRVLAGFFAQTDATYNLSLLVIHADVSLASTEPTVMIMASPDAARAGAVGEAIFNYTAIYIAVFAAVLSIPLLLSAIRVRGR